MKPQIAKRGILRASCNIMLAAAAGKLFTLNDAFAQGIGWEAPFAQKVISLCYIQILERKVDDGGLRDFTDKLVNHNMSTQELVYGLGVSDEYKKRFILPWVPSQNWHPIVSKMYVHFLNRPPENEEVIVRHSVPLHEGNYDELIHTFVYGNEYAQKWGSLGVPGFGSFPVNSMNARSTRVPEYLFYFKLVNNGSSILPCVTEAVLADSEADAKKLVTEKWQGYDATLIAPDQYANYNTCAS